MKRWTLRLGLSLMVVVGICTSRLPAQEPLPAPGNNNGKIHEVEIIPELPIVPIVPYEPATHPPFGSPLVPKQAPTPGKYFYQRALNHFNLGCQADPWGAVQNFHWEMHWMFGSSRWFFGESCAPNQPCADRRYQQP